jgi:hypothetical protein
MANTNNIFTKARVGVETMLTDTINYMVDKFRQAKTNFTVASAYGQILFVLHNLFQLMLLYLEDAVTELNMRTATRKTSVMGLAALAGHNVTRAIGATGEITLVAKNPTAFNYPSGVVVIPNHTKLKCSNNGKPYILDLPTDEARVTTNGSMNGLGFKIVQGTIETSQYTGTGQPLQTFSVNHTQTATIDHYYVRVYVNGERWKTYDSLYDMPRNGKGAIVKTGISGGIDVIFGNSNFGMMPPIGSTILVEYVVTSGEGGNLSLTSDEEGIFRFDDVGFTVFGEDVDLNEVFQIKCTGNPDFGSNPEPLGLTRIIAPKTSRSFVLANPDSYVIFFEKFNLFSIIDAYATFEDSNLYDDKIIYLFLVPDVRKQMKSDENYFNIDESKFTLTDKQKIKVVDLVERSGSKIVGTELEIVSPTMSRYVINISLIIYKDGPGEEAIRQEILERLSEYFITTRRRDRIPKSDLVAIVEGVEGVDSVAISIVSQKDELLFAKGKPPRGLDEFGDIIIEKNELPIIRGGWTDRNGISYETGISDSKPCCVNISVRDTKFSNYNTTINKKNKVAIADRSKVALVQKVKLR